MASWTFLASIYPSIPRDVGVDDGTHRPPRRAGRGPIHGDPCRQATIIAERTGPEPPMDERPLLDPREDEVEVCFPVHPVRVLIRRRRPRGVLQDARARWRPAAGPRG